MKKRSYESVLDLFLDRIFAASVQQGLTLVQLSEKAKLCVTTVDRIDRRDTKLPRLRTIFQLARAVGMEVSLVQQIGQARRYVA